MVGSVATVSFPPMAADVSALGLVVAAVAIPDASCTFGRGREVGFGISHAICMASTSLISSSAVPMNACKAAICAENAADLTVEADVVTADAAEA